MSFNFKLWGIQTVLFLSDFRLDDKLSVAKKLLELTGNIFNGEPLILPTHSDAPKDIPRMILKNTNSSYYVSISLDRVDFNFRVVNEEINLKFEEKIDGYLEVLEKIYSFFLNLEHTRISRVGFVSSFFARLEENTSISIKNKFIKEGLFQDAMSLDIIEGEITNLNSYQFNKITNIKSLRKKREQAFKGLLVEIDMNTIKEEDYDFDEERLKALLEEIKKYIIDNNFPQSVFS